MHEHKGSKQNLRQPDSFCFTLNQNMGGHLLVEETIF